jgi:uncharacterized protein
MIARAGLMGDLEERLRETSFAVVPQFIEAEEARKLRSLYDDDSLFRSRIVMERHAYGRGEYKYFANPLPTAIRALREELYALLQPIANDWMQRMGSKQRFPATHQAFLDECFSSEQKRPTALLLKYGPGDYNRLHQDLYGPVAFPLQTTIYLSRTGQEFEGGEVVLTEQRPRTQTRAHVLTPAQGDLLVLPTRDAPREGAHGTHRVVFRHGVSTVTRGERFTLGIIFHDAL